MIVGWVTVTPLGLRLFVSQQGRFFRDPVASRSREQVIRYCNYRRSLGHRRREAYLRVRQHLRGPLVREIRSSYDGGPGAA